MSDLQLSIMLEHETNMGDHGEFRKIALDYRPGETVEELVQRVADRYSAYTPVGQVKTLKDVDVIEIRQVSS